MEKTLSTFMGARRSRGPALALAAMVAAGCAFAAQQPRSNGADLQREAMRKLAFLAGQWSGPVTIQRGPTGPLRLTQSENVHYKLGGLVLLIEGQSTGADGKPEFQALATVSYDEAAHAYRIRAYNDGHYVDAPFALLADGFSWEFTSGPAHIVNTMRLTPQGEWQEASQVTFGNNPPRPSVDMLLHRQP